MSPRRDWLNKTKGFGTKRSLAKTAGGDHKESGENNTQGEGAWSQTTSQGGEGRQRGSGAEDPGGKNNIVSSYEEKRQARCQGIRQILEGPGGGVSYRLRCENWGGVKIKAVGYICKRHPETD